ncbi:hypothetical protein PN437_02440 [Microcystis aeruginosa CS-564/01]|nr:hypothetical protein [Microcystis aeruginosa]MDB9423792.1 hypothetical protein [Microcystis aeruginosa CS-564/01]
MAGVYKIEISESEAELKQLPRQKKLVQEKKELPRDLEELRLL